MNLRRIGGVLGLTIAPLALGQPLNFEVASIKLNKSMDHRVEMRMMPGGKIAAENVSVRFLMTMAYGIKDNQIAGAPGWVDSERYDIVAKPEGAANQDDIKVMMQGLLAERFGLKFHRETKDLPIYSLVVDKGGPKFKESELPPPQPQGEGGRGGPRGGRTVMMGRGQMTAKGAPMSLLAGQLSNAVGRQVLDKTGLTGLYDITLNWTPDDRQGGRGPADGADAAPASASEAGPSLFNALQEQLGLKLEPQRGPVEIFTIDHVEKPSEN